MPPTNELHRLLGKVEEFMTSTKEDVRELRHELKERDRELKAELKERDKKIDAMFAEVHAKAEKKRGPWLWLLIPGVGSAGAAGGVWSKSMTASIAKFLGN